MIVLNSLATPAPLASCRARIVASEATPWSGLNGSCRACPSTTSGLDVAHQLRQLGDRSAVHLERVVAAVEEDDLGAEDPGGRLRLGASDRP